jgi:quinol monooxygenase YgiN
MRGAVAFVGALVVTGFVGWNGTGLAADLPAKTEGKEPPSLAEALRRSPGCLGVEVARTESGKTVIFAWFEDKKAALAWYKSDVHQESMRRLFPDYVSSRKTLSDVPDDSGPIMAIASLTPKKPTKDDPSPFKQIAIEIYQPLGNGISIGGRFAPEKLKVPPPKSEPKK